MSKQKSKGRETIKALNAITEDTVRNFESLAEQLARVNKALGLIPEPKRKMTPNGFLLLKQYAIEHGQSFPFAKALGCYRALAMACEDPKAQDDLMVLLTEFERVQDAVRVSISDLKQK